MFRPQRATRSRRRRQRIDRSASLTYRRRALVEKLEPRLVLAVTPVADPFVHNDPMFGVDQQNVRVDASALSNDPSTFVTVFEAAGDGDGQGIFAQIHSAANVNTIAVNTTTAGDQTHPDVAIFTDNSFVVTWQGPSSEATDGIDIFFRQFDSGGNEVTPETRVNSTTTGDQIRPAVDASIVGDRGPFVIVWEGPGTDGQEIFAQLFDGDAVAQGSEEVVNATTTGDQTKPDVALGRFGAPMVVWEGLDASGTGIWGQGYTIESDVLVKRHVEFAVNPVAQFGDQHSPRIARGTAAGTTSTTVVSFIGPFDGPSRLDGVFGALISDDGTEFFSDDFLASQGGLNPIGGHDVASTDRNQGNQFTIGWNNGNQITLTQFRADNIAVDGGFEPRAVATFVGRQVVPVEVDRITDVSNTDLNMSSMSLAAAGDLFNDNLVLAANPLVTTTGNGPARQTVLQRYSISPTSIFDSIPSGTVRPEVNVFDDANGDGIQDVGEDPIEGFVFFLDSNGNGIQDPLLPQENVQEVTDVDGNAFLYDGFLKLSPLLGDTHQITTEQTETTVIGYSAPIGENQSLGNLQTFNSVFGTTPDGLGQITDAPGRTTTLRASNDSGFVDLTGWEFIERVDDVYLFRDDSGKLRVFEQKLQLSFAPFTELREIPFSFGGNGSEAIGGFCIDSQLPQIVSHNVLTNTIEFREFQVFSVSLLPIDSLTIELGSESFVAMMKRETPFGDQLIVILKEGEEFKVRIYEPNAEKRMVQVGDDRLINFAFPGELVGARGNTNVPITNDLEVDSALVLELIVQTTFGDDDVVVSFPSTPAGLMSDGTEFAGGLFSRLARVANNKVEIISDAGIATQDIFKWNPDTHRFGFDQTEVLPGNGVTGTANVQRDNQGGFFASFLDQVDYYALTNNVVGSVGVNSEAPAPLKAIVHDNGAGVSNVLIELILDGKTIAHQATGSDGTAVFPMLPDMGSAEVRVGSSFSLGFERFSFSVTPAFQEINLADEPLPIVIFDAGDNAFIDFGDLPLLYPDAEHRWLSFDDPFVVALGNAIDFEFASAPSGDALGDDRFFADDENGVFFNTPIVPGKKATISIVNGGNRPGVVDAFFDFNRDNAFDVGESFLNLPVSVGFNSLDFDIPADALLGDTFARFRISNEGIGAPDGAVIGGEVEDYMIKVIGFDYGDAPDSYLTTDASGGPVHMVDENFSLGFAIDDEVDGQPSVNADGDDLADQNDDDGVKFITDLVPGQMASVEVTQFGPAGILTFFIDFDRNGTFDVRPGDPNNERITQPLSGGAVTDTISFTVPVQADFGSTYARFRLGTVCCLPPAGFQITGEVEDYEVFILGPPPEFDYGDAPLATQSGFANDYPTLKDAAGAAHKVVDGAPYLGTIAPDKDPDGQPTASAEGDDNAFDDEDGVTFTSDLVPGGTATVDVFVTGDGGMLDAFLDFNADGIFDEVTERLFGGTVAVSAGVNTFDISVPADAVLGTTFSRFRISSDGGHGPQGAADDGEVEDHAVDIIMRPDDFDFGDAPLPFPTQGPDAAAHKILEFASLFLGRIPPDPEPDGQPTANADGDDLNNNDDEDEIVAVSSLISSPTNPTIASLEVEVNGSGNLNAWIDFDGDQQWSAAEQIADDLPLGPGTHVISFPVPAAATPGTTYARFRLSTQTEVEPTGVADDGEVEDHLMEIIAAASNTPVNVTIVNDDVTIESGSIVVRSGSTILFSSEVSDIGSLNVSGTDSDETVTLDLGNGFTIPAQGLSVNAGAGSDSLVVLGDQGMIDLTDPLVDFAEIENVDLSDPHVNTIVIDGPSVAGLSPASGLVKISGNEDDLIDVADVEQWRLTEPIRNGSFTFTASNAISGGGQSLEVSVPDPWRNFLRPGDVNNDGDFGAQDILRIINELGRRDFSDAQSDDLMDPLTIAVWPGVYFDYNGDGKASAFDALLGINELGRIRSNGAGPEAEPATVAWFKPKTTEKPTVAEPTASTLSVRELIQGQPGEIGPVVKDTALAAPSTSAKGEEAAAVDRLLTDAEFLDQLGSELRE